MKTAEVSSMRAVYWRSVWLMLWLAGLALALGLASHRV